MSSNIYKDLARGASRFSTIWRVLLLLNAIGWFCMIVGGYTALVSIGWFVWVIPLSLALFVKATLSFFDEMDSSGTKKVE